MDSLSSPSICAQVIRLKPPSHHIDNFKSSKGYATPDFDQTCAVEGSEWDESPMQTSFSSETRPFAALTPGESTPQGGSPPILAARRSHTLSGVHIIVDQYGRECDVVQTRGERRRAQNRKAQRAYRARREAQLKSASSTLAEHQSQLRTLNRHNRELLDTIKRLKAMILQLEAENQLLREMKSTNVNDMDEPGGWMLESPNFTLPLPSELYWNVRERSYTP
ncbi:uncharacterized protein Z519_01479 [Cladophialophora bantiana CBS 173.52]|uniref:BZIP domain-containing protein n=1 Tax=Cladophialophora bantiana (strain ATCC 10958 / CBS 173.52 / CDC B-1940 / NIH 8579) TaxID=1442370 RepID=A0A0D2I3V0_CLAB1|nr:uncharacterized protein Z519_01479 [Cladophialophora bantiana CBS 173.52]KIW97895.1 hypothetical protein Z519_01479 [Cladophialophora bantiana CBS 173.52]